MAKLVEVLSFNATVVRVPFKSRASTEVEATGYAKLEPDGRDTAGSLLVPVWPGVKLGQKVAVTITAWQP